MATRATVHPACVVRVGADGVSVPWLDGVPEIVGVPERGTIEPVRHVTVLGQATLSLLELIGRQPGIPVDSAVDDVSASLDLGASDRAELEAAVAELMAHHLLVPDDAALPPLVTSRRVIDGAVTDGGQPVPSGPTEAELFLDAPVVGLSTPLSFTVGADGFELRDHGGSLVATLTAVEVGVLAAAGSARPADVVVRTAVDCWTGLEVEEAGAILGRLRRLGLLRVTEGVDLLPMRAAVQEQARRKRRHEATLRAMVERERAASEVSGRRRAIVLPIHTEALPSLALGMLVAHAKAYDGGSLGHSYVFADQWYLRAAHVPKLFEALGDWPAVLLFSDYTWNSQEHLSMSAVAKSIAPRCITIHGGPDVPKYEDDAREFFSDNPSVDVAVRGEGEQTFVELLAALRGGWDAGDDGGPDLSALADVAGLTYRTFDGVRRTADRDRITDLDTLPSPYLSGHFDDIDRPAIRYVTLETNRGCPYGCAFCDWGSATVSRIRKFDLGRVKAEMQWAAERGVGVFGIADANFGMLDRDVEIAEWVIELNRRYGVPHDFPVNYAKNKVGNLLQIVRMLTDAGIVTEGLVSVQTMDAAVLKTIRRSNIKLERYAALAGEFRAADLPMYTDVMLGLPGSTIDSLRRDLQATVDRDTQIKLHPTQLLVNSPMNDPGYRAEHGIVARPGLLVEECDTFTADDWAEMMRIRQFHYLAERRGVLRQVATYARAETGMLETDLYDRVRQAGSDPYRWPMLTYLASAATTSFLPPATWRPVVEELGALLVDEVGVPDDSALGVVLTVQHALLPAGRRRFPELLHLPHDYTEWYEAVRTAKRDAAGSDWTAAVPALRDLGPATFAISDEHGSERILGQSVVVAMSEDPAWELVSPVMRNRVPLPDQPMTTGAP